MIAKANTTQRGYGAAHARERARLKIIVDIEGYICTRCHHYRPPGTPFDLDHTDDRAGYNGAACITCNRGAGGRKARANDLRRARRFRPW